jgi:hypothetical protein
MTAQPSQKMTEAAHMKLREYRHYIPRDEVQAVLSAALAADSLIAAAPDLLHAARLAWELLRHQPRKVPPETDTARKLLEAAIAKAEPHGRPE